MREALSEIAHTDKSEKELLPSREVDSWIHHVALHRGTKHARDVLMSHPKAPKFSDSYGSDIYIKIGRTMLALRIRPRKLQCSDVTSAIGD